MDSCSLEETNDRAFCPTLGDWASVMGLVFSILAFVFSKRASKAAREARDSVLQKTLGQDMNEAHRIAAEISRFISMDRFDLASLRAADLMNQTSYLISRWKERLPEDSTNDLVAARALLLSVGETIAKIPTTEMTATRKAKLTQVCQKVNFIFSEQHGHAIRAADTEV